MIKYAHLRIFFLNHQFIIWSVRADCGSYKVATYMQTETPWRKKKKENRRKRKQKEGKQKKKIEKNVMLNVLQMSDALNKGKSTRVKLEE